MQKKTPPKSQPSTAKMPARGRPRAFEREAALRCAMRLFWMKGYEATSIADLTEAMGIATTSLYAAFGSKDALYAEALRYYGATYEHLVWGQFRQGATVRDSVKAYLFDSAAAMTGAGSDLPRGCMATLGTVGSDGHDELAETMRATRAVAFDMLRSRLERGAEGGELPPAFDIAKASRFLQTVQSGMAIRARDGADRAELEGVAEIALAGWDAFVSAARGQDQAEGKA